jgi:miniconductance mechanosensitive channel
LTLRERIEAWLAMAGLQDNGFTYVLMAFGIILLTSLLVHIILHRIVLKTLRRIETGSQYLWHRMLVEQKLFKRMALAFQGALLFTQARIWFDADGLIQPVLLVFAQEWMLVYGLLSLYSLLSTMELVLAPTRAGQDLPLRGIVQGIKLFAALIALILGISLLIGKSPLILFSGLGAMTAVLLLVFKDPLLGLVAGIQLSANNMLKVGDWLEMPKYGADGDVIEISLTTVKVRNWDKTITSIPAYALIADSFKNWRGMQESGGRRIKRAFNIDVTSVHFMTDEEIESLRKLRLLSDYIETKLKEIEEDNRQRGVSEDSALNGRRLTNLGTLRAYLVAYLKANPNVRQDMTSMVRQLQPGSEGIPIEIYCFTKTTVWLEYEAIQSDIFDHVLAVVPAFNLRFHQNPTGHDLQGLRSAGAAPQ